MNITKTLKTIAIAALVAVTLLGSAGVAAGSEGLIFGTSWIEVSAEPLEPAPAPAEALPVDPLPMAPDLGITWEALPEPIGISWE
ncbi:MAG TPA: hypothetical protein VGR87_03185 [Candidatus Limnocylindria bacterium]|jgi:hypothetical protein|nr:hypothetical protein [Candidatus Limnocylindria bacterium]